MALITRRRRGASSAAASMSALSVTSPGLLPGGDVLASLGDRRARRREGGRPRDAGELGRAKEAVDGGQVAAFHP